MRNDHVRLAGAVGAITTGTGDTLVRRGIYANFHKLLLWKIFLGWSKISRINAKNTVL